MSTTMSSLMSIDETQETTFCEDDPTYDNNVSIGGEQEQEQEPIYDNNVSIGGEQEQRLLDYLSNDTDIPIPPLQTSLLGFSKKLTSHLKASRVQLDAFIDEQTRICDTARAEQAAFVKTEQKGISDMIQTLKELQVERGLMESQKESQDLTLVSQMQHLKTQKMDCETEISNLHVTHSELKREMEDQTTMEHAAQSKAERVQTAKQRAEDCKHTTIEELTYAVLKYKKLGLDFVQAKGNALRCNFTCIDPMDPERIFTFVMKVTDDDVYVMEEFEPMLRDGKRVMDLTDELNTTGELSQFIVGIRELFKQTL